MATNRYRELLAEIPKGSFYDSVGQIVPYRSGPYEFLLRGLPPSATFSVYVNDQFRGTVTSDGGGDAIISVTLGYGRQDVVVVGEGVRVPAYLDVRNFATVLAAHAEVISQIDAGLDDVQSSLALETATAGYLGESYGRLVSQPDAFSNWLLDSYRTLVRRLRQGFRIYGSKLEGLRQVVSGYTSSLPRRMTDWRPRWILGGGIGRFSWVRTTSMNYLYDATVDPATGVNRRSVDYVHASVLATAPNIFPGSFTLASPSTLVVTFTAGWDGGSVVVTGTAGDGSSLSETFTGTGEVFGTKTFSTVTDASKGAVGTTGSARIGVPRYFVTLVEVGDYNALGAATLQFLTSPERLQWAGGPTVDVSASSPYLVDGAGRIQLRGPDLAPRFMGLLPDGGGYVVGDEHFLALESDGLGIVLVDLANTGFGGGAGARTAAQVATSINTYFTRDARYGAVAATGSITCLPGAAATTNSFTLDDGINPAVTFTYNAGSPNITVGLGDTAAQVAVATRDTINGLLGALRMSASIDPGDATRVLLVNDFGGTQGNVAIINGGGLAAFTGMSGGVLGTLGVSASSVADGDGIGNFVYLTSLGAVGAAGSMRVLPTGADAASVVFGLPRRRAPLIAPAAFRSVVLDLAAPNRLAEVEDVVVLHAAILDTTSSTSSGFSAPSRVGALEMHFDAAWRGGTVRVFGTDETGASISEDFAATPSAVMTGAGTDPGTGIVTLSSGSLSGVRPGMFLELTTGTPGAGRYITHVMSPTTLKLASPLTFTESFRVLEAPQPVVGARAFLSVVQWSNLTPQTARPSSSPAGSGTLTVIDAGTRGYLARVGRSLRASGTTNGTVTALTLGTARFDITGFEWAHADVGGYVLIQGAVASGNTNNGLHLVTGVGTTLGRLYLRHMDHDRGGAFVNEPLPLGATWRLYSAGELVRVVRKDVLGDLTLLPPGIVGDWATGAVVEDEDEYPLEVAGVDGLGTLTVDVDRAYVPSSSASSSVTLAGTYVPDGFRAYNQASGGPSQNAGYARPRRLLLATNGLDADGIGVGMALERTVDVRSYRGRFLAARFWVQQHKGPSGNRNLRVRFSFDGGATWVLGTVPTGAVALDGSAAVNPQPVAATGLIDVTFSTLTRGALDPSPVYGQVEVPYAADEALVRLEYVTIEAARMSVEGCILSVVPGRGVWLGSSTVIRSDHRSKFGELLYVWSPKALTTAEAGALGLRVVAPTSAALRGQIDRAVNAHGVWDRVDVSEYSGGSPVNVRGTYDDVGWLASTLTNMEVVVGTPARASFVRPSFISLVEREPLTFVAPSNATLGETSAHTGPASESYEEELLLEDGVPVAATPLNVTTTGAAGAVGTPDANGYQLLTDGAANFPPSVVGRSIRLSGTAVPANDGVWIVVERISATQIRFDNAGGAAGAIAPGTYTYNADGVLPWRFLSPTVVQVASVAAGDPASQAVFNASSNYVLSYRRLLRAEPGPFDLGAGYLDYVWLVDATIWRRAEPGSTAYAREEALTFLANYRAPLSTAADASQAATLTADNGLASSVVPQESWSFLDERTVQLDPTVFDSGSIYTLSYVALEAEYPRPADVVIETRSSNVSLADVLLQSWREVHVDEIVDRSHRYHQVRVTLSNVVAGVVERGVGASITGRVVEGTFGPAVVAGRVFRVTTGANSGAAAHIVGVTSTRLTLDTELGTGETFAADYEVRTSVFGTDVEIYGLGLRGVNLYGSPPNAPGII